MHTDTGCTVLNCRSCQASAQRRVIAKRAQRTRLATLEALAQGISDADLESIAKQFPRVLWKAVFKLVYKEQEPITFSRTDAETKLLDECTACGGDGVLHVSVDGFEPHEGALYIQRCNTCQRYGSDLEAAENHGRSILAVLVRDE
jgi:hypothetical protein